MFEQQSLSQFKGPSQYTEVPLPIALIDISLPGLPFLPPPHSHSHLQIWSITLQAKRAPNAGTENHTVHTLVIGHIRQGGREMPKGKISQKCSVVSHPSRIKLNRWQILWTAAAVNPGIRYPIHNSNTRCRVAGMYCWWDKSTDDNRSVNFPITENRSYCLKILQRQDKIIDFFSGKFSALSALR